MNGEGPAAAKPAKPRSRESKQTNKQTNEPSRAAEHGTGMRRPEPRRAAQRLGRPTQQGIAPHAIRPRRGDAARRAARRVRPAGTTAGASPAPYSRIGGRESQTRSAVADRQAKPRAARGVRSGQERAWFMRRFASACSADMSSERCPRARGPTSVLPRTTPSNAPAQSSAATVGACARDPAYACVHRALETAREPCAWRAARCDTAAAHGRLRARLRGSRPRTRATRPPRAPAMFGRRKRSNGGGPMYASVCCVCDRSGRNAALQCRGSEYLRGGEYL